MQNEDGNLLKIIFKIKWFSEMAKVNTVLESLMVQLSAVCEELNYPV